MRFLRSLLVFSFFCLSVVQSASATGLLKKADSLYARRGEDFNKDQLLVASENIQTAIHLYETILIDKADPHQQEVIWKLLRAYYFKGKFIIKDKKQKKELYDRGIELGRAGIDEFSDSPGIHLWLAITWGLWAEQHGLFKAARAGVAGKMRRLCERVIDLDSTYEHGGAYRVLGRLYHKAPKIPLFLNWPSDKKAIMFLKKSNRMGPDNLFTKQFLAEALYDQDQKKQAVDLMLEILNTNRIIEGIVEDTFIKLEVKNTLNIWGYK